MPRRLRQRILLAGLAIAALTQGSLPHGTPAARGTQRDLYNPDHGRLLASLGDSRPVQARLSGLPAYLPCAHGLPARRLGAPPAARSASIPLAREETAEIAQVGAAIRRVAERRPSPENLGALAVFALVSGDPDRAIRGLRQALEGKPGDPVLLNDVAAALLAQAEATGALRPAFYAVEAAEQSIHQRFSLPAAFNVALALEWLGLRSRAIAAWQRYLEKDAASGWAQEAAGHLAHLRQEATEASSAADFSATPEVEMQALGLNLWSDRQLGERVLLGRWAERARAGDERGAENDLAAAERIASSLPAGGGRLLLSATAAIREAERSADRAHWAHLVRGHEELGRAFRLQRSEQTQEAHLLLADAIAELRAGGSPFELRARLLSAASSADAEWEEIQRVGDAAKEGSFLSLVAEAQREAAFRMSLEGRFEASLDAYDDARRGFDVLGEREMATVLTAMRAGLLSAIGNDRLEMEELARALGGAPAVIDPWNRYSIYVLAAGAAAGEFRRSAVELRMEAADVCRELPERPLCRVDSMLWTARLTPDNEVAESSLAGAEKALAQVPKSAGRERTAIDLAAARAQWLGGEGRSPADQEQGAELYAEAARGYEAAGLAPAAARARAERARVLERLGRRTESTAEYREALQIFRRWDRSARFRPEDAEKRVPPELRSVYGRLLDLELEAGDGPSAAALLLTEEMHEKLAPRRGGDLRPPTAGDLGRWLTSLPTGVAAVEYAWPAERPTAWILAGGRIDQVELAPRAGLANRIRGLAAERDLEAWKQKTGSLFEEILAPVVSRLPRGTERLVVVPDEDLYSLPFRALWKPREGRYVDEDLIVTLAPSLGVLLPPAPAGPQRNPVSVLSLGFGSFSHDLGLIPLPRAAAEASAVLAAYEVGEVCAASDWESFRQCAPRAEVIHLATHAGVGSTPAGSWLALPRETVTLDRMWRELPALGNHPLVVLSSCESVAVAGGGEGLGGLARPFLANGARAVVGTLWALPDEDAAALFPALHRAYRRTGDAAAALRSTRERLAVWRERPWAWGCVEAVGR